MRRAVHSSRMRRKSRYEKDKWQDICFGRARGGKRLWAGWTVSKAKYESFGTSPRLGVSYYAVGIIAACVDLFVIVLSNLIVDYLYQLSFYKEGGNLSSTIGIGVASAVLFIMLGYIFKLYKLTCLLEPSKYTFKVVFAWFMSILMITAMFFLLRAGTSFSRGSTAAFAAIAVAPLVFFRLIAARELRSLISQGAISGRRAVVIGDDFELEPLDARSLLINFGLDEVARVSLGGNPRLRGLTATELMKLDNAIAVARRQNAEELVIAFDWSQAELIERIEGRLRMSPLPVQLLPDRVVRSVLGQRNILTIGAIPSVELQRAPLTRPERLAKRACDVVLATIALIVLAPLILLSALVIKLDSAGPIIFRQRRNRLRRPSVLHLQIQNNVGDGGRTSNRSKSATRSARHQSGPRIEAIEHRRTPTAHQCIERRHVAGWPKATRHCA